MATDQERIGAQVRRERTRRGWTNADLAERAGIAPNTLSRIEAGKGVHPGSLRQVLDALGVQEESPEQPDDIATAQLMVGAWLSQIDPASRGHAIRSLAQHMTAYRG